MTPRRATGVLFLISGAAGLLYEVVWVRLLGLIVGGESVASQAVMSAYFVGMAAGAALLGPRLDRTKSALRAYARLELAVAASGLYSLAALSALDRLVPRLSSGDAGPALGALAFAAALAAFLPATFFMGATLPALVRGLVTALPETPRTLGRLYALNTLGAVVGSLATGFALLAAVGSRTTVLLAASLNLVAAAGAWAVARAVGKTANEADGRTGATTIGTPADEMATSTVGAGHGAGAEAAATASAASARSEGHGGTAAGKTHGAAPGQAPGKAPGKGAKKRRRPAGKGDAAAAAPRDAGWSRAALLGALALAGFAAISFETAAVRVLAATFESTVYSFAATLGAYLLGIVIASGAFARWPIDARRPGRPALLLACAAAAMGVAAQLLRLSGPLHAALVDAFEDSWRGRLGAEMVTAALLVLPAAVPTTLLFCALAPLAVRDTERTAGAIGAATMANTLGCALAPLAAALVILPLDGSRGALRAAVVALAAAVALCGSAASQPVPVVASGLGLLCALTLPVHLYSWPLVEGHRLVYAHEGAAAAIAVEERDGSRVLRTGQHYFEGGSSSVFAERRQGHLPMLLHPAPHRALVLGIGTGTTLGAIGRHPGVEIDGVELLDEVLEALRYFDGSNDGVLGNRAIKLHQADARSFVRAAAAAGRRYDVIVADLFHPQQSGVGNLYTREHFAAVRAALAPGGLFMQWLSLYELPPDALATIVRTFLDVFPEASGWYAHFNAKTGILGLLGSERPLGLDWDRVLGRAADPALHDVLGASLLDRPMELLGSYVTDRAGLAAIAAGAAGPLNTDDRPVLEYTVPRGHSLDDVAVRLRSLAAVMAVRRLPGEATLHLSGDPTEAAARRATLGAHQEAIDALIRGQRASALDDNKGAVQAYEAGLRAAPDFKVNYILLRDLAIEMAKAGRLAEAEEVLTFVTGLQPDNAEAAALLERLHAARGP